MQSRPSFNKIDKLGKPAYKRHLLKVGKAPLIASYSSSTGAEPSISQIVARGGDRRNVQVTLPKLSYMDD